MTTLLIMRLINTSTGLFEEFIGRNIPKYAILSHTWEEEEVSFKDMSDHSYRSKKGHQKIAMTCQLARQARIEYAWVDTCCIDKSSSAELSEAINSMYRWYQRAKSATPIFQIYQLPRTWIPRYQSVDGSREDGHCRSSLLRKAFSSLIKTGT